MEEKDAGERNSADARKSILLHCACYRYTGGQGTSFGRRPRKLHIPRPAASGRSRPLRCSSSPNSKHFAGLLFGPISVLPEKSMQKRGAGREIALTRRKTGRSVVRVIVTLSVVRTPFGRRPRKLHIPRCAASGKARPFRCSSFPKHKRFAGLCFGSLASSCLCPLNI